MVKKKNICWSRASKYEDIDFENNKREQVINYVKKRYGLYHVAGGLTYSTYKSRLVLREVGKILKIFS